MTFWATDEWLFSLAEGPPAQRPSPCQLASWLADSDHLSRGSSTEWEASFFRYLDLDHEELISAYLQRAIP